MELAAIIAILLPLVTMAAYATIGYLANLSGSEATEKFDPRKIMGVFLISVFIAVVNYMRGTEVSIDMIIQVLLANGGLLYFADKGSKAVARSKTVATVSGSSESGWDGTLGLTILPTQQEGVSPFKALIDIRASPNEGEFQANEAMIDWGDGSLTTSVALFYGEGSASHEYTYKKTPEGKSWSRQFKPTVQVRNSQGKTKDAYVIVYCYDPEYLGPK